MAYKAMPYRGDEYGFPKTIPENLPSSGFEGWIIQEGYPVSLITDIPGFTGTGWFCHCYDDTNTASTYHPDNPNYLDPYDPANFAREPTAEEIAADAAEQAAANTTFTTATVSTT